MTTGIIYSLLSEEEQFYKQAQYVLQTFALAGFTTPLTNDDLQIFYTKVIPDTRSEIKCSINQWNDFAKKHNVGITHENDHQCIVNGLHRVCKITREGFGKKTFSYIDIESLPIFDNSGYITPPEKSSRKRKSVEIETVSKKLKTVREPKPESVKEPEYFTDCMDMQPLFSEVDLNNFGYQSQDFYLPAYQQFDDADAEEIERIMNMELDMDTTVESSGTTPSLDTVAAQYGVSLPTTDELSQWLTQENLDIDGFLKGPIQFNVIDHWNTPIPMSC